MKQGVKQIGWLAVCLCGIALSMSGCSKTDTGDNTDEMILRRRMPTKLQTLDAGNMRGVYSMEVGGQIYETLYTYHLLKRPYEITPLLAEALPHVSADNLTYTIRIKQGVRFQNDPCFEGGQGRELTADDFVYALKRVANIKYLNQNWSGLKDKIVGLDDFREYTKQFKKELDVDYSREVEGLKALDDYTLRIKLIQPWPQLVESVLTDILSSPVPHEAVEHYGFDIIRHPVGTGPYRLKTWRRGCYIELVRNENWRNELYPAEGQPGDEAAGLLDDAGSPVPFADRIIWRVILEDQPAWMLFMRGELDATGIPKDNFGEAISQQNMDLTDEMRARGIVLKSFDDPSVFWIGFNMADPVLGKNKPLRKALSRTIDRERFIDLFFNGRGHVAHGFVAPGLDSYDLEIARFGYSKYDLQEARELMVEAEAINDGPIGPLKLGMPGTDTFSKQYGQFVQRQFEKVGVMLEVDYMDWPTYMAELNKGQLQLFCSGVSAGAPDAIDFLGMFATKYFSPGGNKFYYSNPEFDELFDKAEVMLTSPERMELYRKLERMVMEDYPAIFTTHRVSYVLHHSWYKNYKPHVFSHRTSKYRKVDVQERNGYKQRLKELKMQEKMAK
ncbi:MAG: ABC transporter substrate-binding protein [Planctomycetota bacterium]